MIKTVADVTKHHNYERTFDAWNEEPETERNEYDGLKRIGSIARERKF